jgi:hypothetical protein
MARYFYLSSQLSGFVMVQQSIAHSHGEWNVPAGATDAPTTPSEDEKSA